MIGLKPSKKIKIFNALPKGPAGVVFNTQKEPWDDIRIRKAFAHVFDVETLNSFMIFLQSLLGISLLQ